MKIISIIFFFLFIADEIYIYVHNIDKIIIEFKSLDQKLT
jgi:hypothetical protein